MLGFLHTHKEKKNFQVMGVYSVFWGFVTQLWSPSNVCVRVWNMDTCCVHTQNSLSVFHTWHRVFCLHCTLVWLFIRKTHLHQTPSWLWLLCTSSPVFRVLDRWTKPCNSLTPSCMCVWGNLLLQVDCGYISTHHLFISAHSVYLYKNKIM